MRSANFSTRFDDCSLISRVSPVAPSQGQQDVVDLVDDHGRQAPMTVPSTMTSRGRVIRARADHQHLLFTA